MSTNEKILQSYNESNYKEILDRLDTVIDDMGNTIIHHIASKLDKDSIESLKKLDKKCITYTLMNKANKNGDLPIHLALKTLIEKDADSHDFIDYLINECHANPNIPNNEDMVITQKKEPVHIPQSSAPQTDHFDFISKLIQYYINSFNQPTAQIKGGYSSKRIIRSKVSDFTDSDVLPDSGVNDTFRLTKNKRIHHKINNVDSQDGGKRDPKITDTYNQILKKIIKVLNVDEATAKLYRMALKKKVIDDDPDLRKGSNDAKKMEAIEKLLGDDKNAKKVLNKISPDTIDGLRTWLSEQDAKRSENSESIKKKDDKPKEKKAKKVTKKAHESEKGYLHSDEILFSPDYF
uniref:Ankyrin repeat protein n=1 Tax=viral metagenome TaxID=1070528 RepID=A0A6C0CAA7_9ZZZZ